MPRRTAHIQIEGRVQGVGFRAWVEQEAVSREIVGWVRNRRTGAVEAMIDGDDATIAGFIEACRRGPPAARVDALFVIGDVGDGSLGSFSSFEVRPTV